MPTTQLTTRPVGNDINSALVTSGGVPIANARIDYILVSSNGVQSDVFDAIDGHRIGSVTSVYTDAFGVHLANLWPNDRGAHASQYICRVNVAGFTDFTASVPSGSTVLSWVNFMAGGAPLTPAQIDAAALAMSVTAANAVTASAQAALAAADVVLTHADVILTHADVVSTHADVATTGTNATTATTQAGIATADVILTHADVVSTHADVATTRTNATTATTQAGISTAQAAAAAASATSALTGAGAASWVSGSYNVGAVVWSPINFLTYRAKTTGSKVTDPANNPTNWTPIIPVVTNFAIEINNIGIPGTAGFGVGICPSPPPGMYPMSNSTFNPMADDYGNYQNATDGSIMVWIPNFYYKLGTGSNGFAVNICDIKPFSAYANVAAANTAGYALHRAFYDGGILQPGMFVDKYKCSNNGGIASSIKNGNPLSSNAMNNPFSGLTGAPANFYYGVIAAAKTRGANFFPASLFINKSLAMLSLSHGQFATSTTFCAWYDPAGITNYPKGCNNNALGDANDAALSFVSTGNATYPAANKTGSANFFARTTHNGQACGVADLNGTIYEVCLGLTSDGTNYYLLNTSVAMKSVTAGNTLATDAWGATAYAAQYTSLGTTYGALWATGANRVVAFGSASQVFNEATSGGAWAATGAGLPLAAGIGGTNAFGNDYLYDYKPNEMCPLAAFDWSDGSAAGVWALDLATVRGGSGGAVGLRAALYL